MSKIALAAILIFLLADRASANEECGFFVEMKHASKVTWSPVQLEIFQNDRRIEGPFIKTNRLEIQTTGLFCLPIDVQVEFRLTSVDGPSKFRDGISYTLKKDGDLLSDSFQSVVPNTKSKMYTFYAPAHDFYGLSFYGLPVLSPSPVLSPTNITGPFGPAAVEVRLGLCSDRNCRGEGRGLYSSKIGGLRLDRPW